MLIFVKSSKLSICFICIQFLTNRTHTDAIVIVVVSNTSCIYEINTKKKDTKCKTSNCNVNRTKSWNRKTVRSFVENSIRFELDLDLTRFQYTCMNTNAQHKCVFMSRWELFFYSFDVLVFFFFFFFWFAFFFFFKQSSQLLDILVSWWFEMFLWLCFFILFYFICTFDGENNIWLTVATIHFSKRVERNW